MLALKHKKIIIFFFDIYFTFNICDEVYFGFNVFLPGTAEELGRGRLRVPLLLSVKRLTSSVLVEFPKPLIVAILHSKQALEIMFQSNLPLVNT